MSSGKPGHTGHTGLQGRRGLQGTPYGPAGTTFYSTSGLVTTSNITGAVRPITISNYDEHSGRLFNFPGSGGNWTITLPTSNSSNYYGVFWTFTNNTSTANDLVLTFSNTAGIQYNGITDATIATLAPNQSVTLVYSDGSNTTSTYIAI
jgi:hypothetical protein